MPQLKQLSCSVQWASTGAPFQEYGTVYGDGVVETFIAVPNKPQHFTIRLKSLSYISDGLAAVIFIDGKYQANRNRVNLRRGNKNDHNTQTRVDFLMRQKEKPIGEGVYMGRQWRFDNHGIGSTLYIDIVSELTLIVDNLPDGVEETHFNLLGTIEVLVLRCSARLVTEKDDSGDSSAADSDILNDSSDGKVSRHGDGSWENESNSSHIRIFGGGDATNDRDHHSYNQRGRSPFCTGWPPAYAPSSARGRPLHQHTRNVSQPQHDPNYYQNQPNTQDNSSSHQKHVRFELDRTNSNSTDNTSRRPSSHERSRPSSHVPTEKSYHTSSPSCDPQTVPYSGRPPPFPHAPVHYTPFPPNILNHGTRSQAIPVGHPSLPFVSAPQTYYHAPSWTADAPIPPVAWHQPQPPHVIYYPVYQGQGPWWPHPTSSNAAAPPAAEATHENASAYDDQDQNDGNDCTQPVDNYNSHGDSVSNTGNEDANHSASATNYDQNNGSGNDWNAPSNPTTQNVDNNYNNSYDQGNYTELGQQDDNLVQPDADQDWDAGQQVDSSEIDRALFGPHGEYYTYHPRGPDAPTPDAEEEPRFDVPRSVANATGSTKQVLPGSGYIYCKKRCAPEYLDAMDEPYARFVFKYRTTDQIERELGITLDVEPTDDEAVQELQNMDKKDLINMVIRAKSALGGKVPSPPAQPVLPTNDHGVPVPVAPPNQPFLMYKLPELRRSSVNVAVGSNVSGGGGGGGGNNGNNQWDLDNNNNDTFQADNRRHSTSYAPAYGSSKTALPGEDPNINWNRAGDGSGEAGTTNFNGNNTGEFNALRNSVANAFGRNDQHMQANQRTSGFDNNNNNNSGRNASGVSNTSTLSQRQPLHSSIPPRPPPPPPPPQGSPTNWANAGGANDTAAAAPAAGW